jgi:hypothetical protein
MPMISDVIAAIALIISLISFVLAIVEKKPSAGRIYHQSTSRREGICRLCRSPNTTPQAILEKRPKRYYHSAHNGMDF